MTTTVIWPSLADESSVLYGLAHEAARHLLVSFLLRGFDVN
jgi:hypothetical protein